MTRRILYVEDDVHVRELMVHRLESHGYEVVTYGNGLECWQQLEGTEAPPVAALIDVQLPGIDGFALLKRLRDQPETKDVPTVMLTAKGNERDVIHAFELGADDYVTKPFSPSEVLARLNRLT